MARPGPHPQPTIQKKLRGNPGHKPLPKNEPKPEVSQKIPSPPKHLNSVAKKEWKKQAKSLHPLGLLTKIDLTAFAAYCTTYAVWLDAQEKLEKTGLLIKAPSGYPVQSPYVSIANKTMSEMRKWLIEFGMTPSSRVRIQDNSKDGSGKISVADLAEDLRMFTGNAFDTIPGGSTLFDDDKEGII